MTDPNFALDGIARAHLAVLVTEPGFKIFKQLMEAEVEKFNVALLNASPANASDVLAAHQMAKAAAQFYVGLIKRLNNEIEIYKSLPNDKPVDVTEGMIDLGETYDGGE